MTAAEWAELDRENLEAAALANHRTVPSQYTGYSIPASAEDAEAMEMANGYTVPFSYCTGYHIPASREDTEAMRLAQGETWPLSPGSIHRTYTINEDGQVEAVAPADYREPVSLRIAKAVLIAALACYAAAWLAEAIAEKHSNPVAYAAIACVVALLGCLARK